MMIAKTLAATTLALAALGLAGCGGGVEGSYKLDKAEAKKAMEAELAKLPAEQQAFGKLAAAMIDAMDVTVELQPGGKMTMKSSMPGLEAGKPAKTDEKTGTWKMDGDSVVLETDGKPVKCAKSGSKLNCAAQKQGDPPLVLVKS